MQLQRFRIEELFRTLDHDITFPVAEEEGTGPAFLVLYGRNGVGKTTILRMIEGLLRLDFNPFRRVPFGRCSLDFTSGDKLTVEPAGEGAERGLDVAFREHAVRLDPDEPGPLRPMDSESVERFREEFLVEAESIDYELIDTARLHETGVPRRERARTHGHMLVSRGVYRPNPKARARPRWRSLASRVRAFYRDAQVNYRNYFTTTEPDLFPRILERLTSGEEQKYAVSDLRKRLEAINTENEFIEELGLAAESWDYLTLRRQLKKLATRRDTARDQALTVLDSYLEVLESRTAERSLIAERIKTFEQIAASFLVGKTVKADPRHGFVIRTDAGHVIGEDQLSSGELHLLFLLVAALVAEKRGTVIAIDEPEMSMHVAWQRKLTSALRDCAAGAEPLFILATHSPELVASQAGALVELTG